MPFRFASIPSKHDTIILKIGTHLPILEVVLDIGGRCPAKSTLGCIRGIFGGRHVKIGG